MDKPYDYDIITSLYTSAGVLQNKGSYTPYTKSKILRLRDDVDALGETLGQTGANWTNNNYNWSIGDRYNLASSKRIKLSYITDLRAACEDLSTTAGIGAPSWTIATASLILANCLYTHRTNATISSGVLTQPGGDFTEITNNNDYCYIRSGTGVTPGRYQITAHNAASPATITLSGNSDTSATGDLTYEVMYSGNKGVYVHSNKKSLITDIQTAIMDIIEDAGTVKYWVDAQNGDDANGGTSSSDAFETWDKAVTECNSAAGNILLMARADGAVAEYTVDGTTLTATNIKIFGAGTDLVSLNVPATNPLTPLSDNDNQDWQDIHFGNGTDTQWFTVDAGNDGITFTRCIFEGIDDVGSSCMTAANVEVTFNNCLFLGVNTKGTGFIQAIAKSVIFNDCGFKSLDTCIKSSSGASATVTMNYCGFYDFNTKTSGDATFVSNNEFSTTLDPEIIDNSSGYLSDTSPYIDEASDGSDIGAYPDSPYNRIRSASDSIGLAETAAETIIHTVTDGFVIHEDLSTINMNVSVDLALCGLFRSTAAGVVTYYTANDIDTTYSAIMNDHITNWQYDGSTLDLSWDNSGGDTFDVHIAVDDGSTDYAPVAWWEVNALNPTANTSDTVGTRGYAFSCSDDTELANEWGDQGVFSTVAADGVNDQQWDVTLKIRLKNINTGQWSELVTLSKTYNFNTFADTMYYLADNPRTVDDEYANHANYLAQIYHTGTDKYTRIDGVDWAADNRRYAYNPHVKSKHHTITTTGGSAHSNKVYEYWRNRNTGTFQPFGEANARAVLDLYPCVFSNYGNYNNSDHCFATTGNIINDNGSYESDVPIIGDTAASGSPSNVPYVFMQAYIAGDCNAHSSARGFLVWLPSGEIIGHLAGALGDEMNVGTDLYFETIQFGACPPARFYLRTIGAGQTYWWFSSAEVKINEDDTASPYTGFISFLGAHDAGTPF